MDKLYWIVCEESDQTLYEGRFLGRTRGAALKHLKDQLGRASLTGLVFSITEIPVPLIRQIVAEILGQPGADVPEIRPAIPQPKEERFDAFTDEKEEEAVEATPPAPLSDPKPRSQYDWEKIKACYMEGRGPTDVAKLMDVPLNTLRGRIRRECWAHERREVEA
jgi:hypothetical protein